MSKKNEGHKNLHVVRRMSVEEAQRCMKKREEMAIRQIRKFMQKIDKNLNEVEELLEVDTLADNISDVRGDENENVKAETSTLSAKQARIFLRSLRSTKRS